MPGMRLWQTGTFSTAEWLVDPPELLFRAQSNRRCRGCCGVPPHPPFRIEALIFPHCRHYWLFTTHPSPRLALSQIIPLPQEQPASNALWEYKGLTPLSQSEAPLKGHPSSRIPHGVGWGLCTDCIKVQLLPCLLLLIGIDLESSSQ